jgi:L-threonylcarbamoyladenylate synthase
MKMLYYTMTQINNITEAVHLLQLGGLVAFPTETVYGLGADAHNEKAVRKVFRAKERPYDHPLIVHLAVFDQVKDWARDIPLAAVKLAEAFWPGPLTLILKKQSHVPDVLTANQDTVGLRIPSHPVAQALLQAFKGGIAAPSANKFTHISPTAAAAVREELGNKVNLILDGGDCTVGLESTIIDLSHEVPVILRPGMITAAMIAKVLNCPVTAARQDTPTRAPGMHHLHYAPTTKTMLIATRDIATFAAALQAADFPIAFVTHSHPNLNPAIYHVTMPHNAAEYAHDLYRTLRHLDHQGFTRILIETVPPHPEWEAIRDRLVKASFCF